LQLHLYVLAIPFVVLLVARVVRGRSPSASPRGPWELLAAIVLPYLAYVATTGGDFMPLFRFVAPVLPLLAIAAGHGFDAMAGQFGRRAWGVAAAAVVFAAFAGLNLNQSRHEQDSWAGRQMESVGLQRENVAAWRRIGVRLGELALPSDSLATTAAGVIPYVSRLHTIDLLGLTAPDQAPYRRRTGTRAAHNYYLSGPALAAMRPQFILGHPETRKHPRRLGLTLDVEPEWMDAVLEDYEMIALHLPGTPDIFVGLGIRKDAAERLERTHGLVGP
jgi:hypothetical protein